MDGEKTVRLETLEGTCREGGGGGDVATKPPGSLCMKSDDVEILAPSLQRLQVMCISMLWPTTPCTGRW